MVFGFGIIDADAAQCRAGSSSMHVTNQSGTELRATARRGPRHDAAERGASIAVRPTNVRTAVRAALLEPTRGRGCALPAAPDASSAEAEVRVGVADVEQEDHSSFPGSRRRR